jgi:hypothetical protein
VRIATARAAALVAGLGAAALGVAEAAAATRSDELSEAILDVRTIAATKLRGAPRDDAKVIGRIKANRPVEVLGRLGRWVEVRHRGRHGWIPRSALEIGRDRDDDEIAAAKADAIMGVGKQGKEAANAERREGGRRAARRRGEGGAVRVTRFVNPEGKPRTGIDQSTSGGERRVSVAAPSEPSAPTAAREPEERALVRRASPEPAGGRTLAVAVGAALGYSATTMRRVSTGGEGEALTNLVSPSAELGVRAAVPVGGVALGGDVAMLAGFGGTLEHQTSAGEIADTEARRLSLTAVATASVGRALRGGVRAGYHYDRLAVAAVDNAARLPSEALAGPIVGGQVAATLGAVDLSATLDYMIAGGLDQSAGLGDGEATTPSALIGHAELGWRLAARWVVAAGYRFDRVRTAFAGGSLRTPEAADTRRSDLGHSALVGVRLDL